MATQNAINLSAAGVVSYNGTGTFTGSPITQNAMLYGGASNAITSTAAPTNGQLLIGSTGAAPVLASLTAGSNITITPGAGSITIAATTPDAFPYTVVTGTTQTIAVNNGYFPNNAGLVTFTLPATAAVGTAFRVTGFGAGGWIIAQNAGQSINMSSSSTTTGTGGSLASTNRGDCVRIVCVVADTTFIVEDSVGNITVV